MSLSVVIKGPEGVVLAADSRVTLTVQRPDGGSLPVNFDNATKLLTFSEPHNYVGAVTYGAAVIGLRTAQSFLPELEVELPENGRLKVLDYAQLFSDFYMRQWNEIVPEDYDGASMIFIIGGYNEDEPYGRVYLVDIPRNPTPVEQNPGKNNFGMTWGGQLQMASRMIHGYDPVLMSILKEEFDLKDKDIQSLEEKLKEVIEYRIPYQVLPLQDCVDLAHLMLRTTMDAQELSISMRGVGGPIDLVTITRTDGLKEIRRKSITMD